MMNFYCRVDPSHERPRTSRLCICVAWYLPVDDHFHNFEVHNSEYYSFMTTFYYSSEAQSYDSIKARVRVGRAAMVLCAIPLDAGSLLLRHNPTVTPTEHLRY